MSGKGDKIDPDPTLWRERVHVQGTRIENNEVWVLLSAANAPRHTLPMALFAAGQTLVVEIKFDPLGVHTGQKVDAETLMKIALKRVDEKHELKDVTEDEPGA